MNILGRRTIIGNRTYHRSKLLVIRCHCTAISQSSKIFCRIETESGRISKIAQPEKDELLLTIKGNRENFRLLISANASLPLLYFTETNKPSPLTAPNFCMLLRKRIANGRIVSVSQPGLERIVRIEIEHLDEMGDLKRKFLIVELMGKHSNIIFCDEDGTILDAVKRVDMSMSSVRQILPTGKYTLPPAQNKRWLLSHSKEELAEAVAARFDGDLHRACMKTLAGIVSGYSDSLLLRAADVTLKERRPLVLMPRECPLSTLHLRNLTAASELGAVIVPPVPAYYQHPKCIDDINGRISAKVLALFGLDTGAIPEWGGLDL